MSEKRRETRLLCAELVDVRFRSESGRWQRCVANLEDICATGLCLQSETRIPDGTKLRVSYPEGELFGTVRYCVFREVGFLIGVEFDSGCRWSETSFRPEHLLNPRLFTETMVH
jgi:hypothetical protein